jgi:fumarate reductase subunit D
MRYLDRLPTEPLIWLMLAIGGAIVAVIAYIVLTSITY